MRELGQVEVQVGNKEAVEARPLRLFAARKQIVAVADPDAGLEICRNRTAAELYPSHPDPVTMFTAAGLGKV